MTRTCKRNLWEAIVIALLGLAAIIAVICAIHRANRLEDQLPTIQEPAPLATTTLMIKDNEQGLIRVMAMTSPSRIEPPIPPIKLEPKMQMSKARINAFYYEEGVWNASVETSTGVYTVVIPECILDDVSVGDELWVQVFMNSVANYAGLNVKTM